jgi:cytidylate kinase
MPNNPRSVVAALPTLQLGTKITGHSARLTLSGWVPMDAELRSPEVNAAVSAFAAMSEVRNFLFDYQRGQVDIAREAGFSGVIMEGRDIGSIIMPDAEVRIFLDADVQARTARRAAEGQADAILSRDQQDASRITAPLICPEGAMRIDNTSLSFSEVVEKVSLIIAQSRR